MWICKSCQSSDVEVRAWVNPNNNQVKDIQIDTYWDNPGVTWCNSCDGRSCLEYIECLT